MNYGYATFKLPFPAVEEKSISRARRVWTPDGLPQPEAKFHDANNTRQNWKRFKKLCASLKAEGFDYSVIFHFETINNSVDRFSPVKTVAGVRAEVSWGVRA